MNKRTAIARIAEAETDSVVLSVGRFTVVGIIPPATMTGSSLVVHVRHHGESEFVPLMVLEDPGGEPVEVTIPTSPSAAVAIPPWWTHGWAYIKLVSNAAEAADRDIAVMVASV